MTIISGIFDLEIDLIDCKRQCLQNTLAKDSSSQNSPIASAFRVRNSEFMFSIRKATKAEVQVTETCGRYLYALQLENTKFNLLSPEKVNFSLGLW